MTWKNEKAANDNQTIENIPEKVPNDDQHVASNT
jgi:hypothetical protein